MEEPESRIGGIQSVIFADAMAWLGLYDDSGYYLATFRRLVSRGGYAPILHC